MVEREKNPPELVENAAVPIIYYDGLETIGTVNGMMHIALWVEEPVIGDGIARVVVARLIIRRDNLARAYRVVGEEIAPSESSRKPTCTGGNGRH